MAGQEVNQEEMRYLKKNGLKIEVEFGKLSAVEGVGEAKRMP